MRSCPRSETDTYTLASIHSKDGGTCTGMHWPALPFLLYFHFLGTISPGASPPRSHPDTDSRRRDGGKRGSKVHKRLQFGALIITAAGRLTKAKKDSVKLSGHFPENRQPGDYYR